MDVAVTGAGGLVGERLVASLARDEAVDRVLALDAVPARVPAGVASGVADVTDPAIGTRLSGVDVLVHLAFPVDPLRDDDRVHAANVRGTMTTLEAAVAAGVRRIVVASSGSVYGAHPDNDVPLSESSPRRPIEAFSYARHKGEVESWLWGWAATLPEDVTLTVLRPAIVAGPGVDNMLSRQLEAPRFLTVAGHRPPVQVVHLDDLVAAFHHAATHDLPGAYNVAAPGWVSLDEALHVLHRRPLDVPEEVARAVGGALASVGLGEAPAGMLPYVMYPWVLDVSRLEATGWAAHHSNRSALHELAVQSGRHVRLGPVRVRRRDVALAVVLGVALAAGVLVRAVLRR